MELQNLTKERKREMIEAIKLFFNEEYDEQMSEFKAEQILVFMLSSIGDSVYEQAIEDAHRFMSQKIEDLYALPYQRYRK